MTAPTLGPMTVAIGRCHEATLGPGGVAGAALLLGPREREAYDHLRLEPRRRSFVLGRVAAKLALRATACPGAAPSAIEVVAALDGAPEPFLDGAPLPVTISISHTGSGAQALAACAVALQPIALGLDVETIEPRSPAFVADFFTPREQRFVALATEATVPPAALDSAALRANLVWSAKESALKALRVGLREDTLAVEVDPSPALAVAIAGEAAWSPLAVRHRAGPAFTGWWRSDRSRVWTILAAQPIAPPHEVDATPPW